MKIAIVIAYITAESLVKNDSAKEAETAYSSRAIEATHLSDKSLNRLFSDLNT